MEFDAANAADHEVIALSPAQIAEFAGNAIELTGCDGRLLAMSSRAVASLTAAQIRVIEGSAHRGFASADD
jgi:hypothetical protein